MASIMKKTLKGRTYFYAAQSGRVNGQPRIVWQQYLGTLDDIVKRSSDCTDIFEFGGIAALLGIAEKIGICKIIDDVVPSGGQKPPVGKYILLAAINRVLAPCSKSKMPNWYQNTILLRRANNRLRFLSRVFWMAPSDKVLDDFRLFPSHLQVTS